MNPGCRTWIQTFPSNGAVNLLDLRPEDVRVADVAHHLGHLCRYTGGVAKHYSVAEHCVRVSQAVEASMRAANAYEPEEIRLTALTALVHDASEAYTNDLSQPAKIALRQLDYERDEYANLLEEPQAPKGYRSPYDLLEERIQRVIAERFGVPFPFPPVVGHFDLVLLQTERRDLLGPEPQPWNVPDEVKPLEGRIEPWTAQEASERWLVRLRQLGGWS